MKRTAFLLSLVVVAGVAQAGSLKDHALALNKAVMKTMKAKDIAAFEKLMKPNVTADFKYIEYGQVQDFKTMVENMKMGFKMMGKLLKHDLKIVSVSEGPNSGTFTYKTQMESTIIGEDKKTHIMGFGGTAVDTFRKEGGKWKLATMTWKEMKMTLDGKPFDPSKMTPPDKSGH